MSQRKTIAAALAAFICIPLILSGGLQVFQAYLKYRAQHRLETETLVSIQVPSQHVKWIEDDEVMIQGKMFDIKTYHETDGFFHAVGVWDEKETKVMQLMNNFNDSQQQALIIRLLIFSEVLIALVLGFAILKRFIDLRSFTFFPGFYIPDPFFEKKSPPPKAFPVHRM